MSDFNRNPERLNWATDTAWRLEQDVLERRAEQQERDSEALYGVYRPNAVPHRKLQPPQETAEAGPPQARPAAAEKQQAEPKPLQRPA
jgi:hypothetical protein